MSFKVVGDDELVKKLVKLSDETEAIFKQALFEGAKDVADSVKASMNSIPVDNRTHGSEEDPLKGLTAKQKEDCIAAMGIAEFKGESTIDTHIGFDGYTVNANNGTSRKYPKGIPIPMLMRALESGTSFRSKYPAVRNGINKARSKAAASMEKELKKQIDERFGG